MAPITMRKRPDPQQCSDMAKAVGIDYPSQGADYAGVGGPSVWFGTPDQHGYCGFFLLYEHWDVQIAVAGQVQQGVRNQLYSLCFRMNALADIITSMEEELMATFDCARYVEKMLVVEAGYVVIDPS